jgi:hypothetical protein
MKALIVVFLMLNVISNMKFLLLLVVKDWLEFRLAIECLSIKYHPRNSVFYTKSRQSQNGD